MAIFSGTGRPPEAGPEKAADSAELSRQGNLVSSPCLESGSEFTVAGAHLACQARRECRFIKDFLRLAPPSPGYFVSIT